MFAKNEQMEDNIVMENIFRSFLRAIFRILKIKQLKICSLNILEICSQEYIQNMFIGV